MYTTLSFFLSCVVFLRVCSYRRGEKKKKRWGVLKGEDTKVGPGLVPGVGSEMHLHRSNLKTTSHQLTIFMCYYSLYVESFCCSIITLSPYHFICFFLHVPFCLPSKFLLAFLDDFTTNIRLIRRSPLYIIDLRIFTN